MNILVTGNRGYIGSVLTPLLVMRGHKVTGLDLGLYEDVALPPVPEPHWQIKKDVRDVEREDLVNIDAIIHLAALSNDPLGELDERLTEEINRDATIRLAMLAKQSGVQRFVYASSQSMYGVSDSNVEVEEESGDAKNAITAYARTKWESEVGIKPLGDENFTVVCLRPATVFGASARLRSDIVFNSFMGCAYTTGRIEIKSDGTPWRPIIHVRDVSHAFIAALSAPREIVAGESFNVGIPNGNYTVREIAEAAARGVPGVSLTFTGEHADSRSYRVSFKKILSTLRDYYRPEWNLDRGAKELMDFYRSIGFSEELFRGRDTNRLMQIRHLRETGRIGLDLRLIQ